MSVRTEPESHQYVCDRCGWHTVPMLNRKRVTHLGEVHDETCPVPVPPRNGALMSCGCWWWADPGSSVGCTTAVCPKHERSETMVKANVEEPAGTSSDKFWTHPFAPVPTEEG